jgi:predicted DNA-binding WGR domain protein
MAQKMTTNRDPSDVSPDVPPPFVLFFTQFARFELRDPVRNRQRFYVFSWQMSLWAGQVLLARWGRLGQRPRGPKVLSMRPGPPGVEALDRLVRRRHARGYRLVDWR